MNLSFYHTFRQVLFCVFFIFFLLFFGGLFLLVQDEDFYAFVGEAFLICLVFVLVCLSLLLLVVLFCYLTE